MNKQERTLAFRLCGVGYGVEYKSAPKVVMRDRARALFKEAVSDIYNGSIEVSFGWDDTSCIYVAFDGSKGDLLGEVSPDWKRNYDADFTDYKGISFHNGFLSAAKSSYSFSLEDSFRKFGKIIITGYSQGAGIAQIFAYMLHLKGFVVECIPFASPRITDKTGERKLRQILNHEHHCLLGDIVPQIPLNESDFNEVMCGNIFSAFKSIRGYYMNKNTMIYTKRGKSRKYDWLYSLRLLWSLKSHLFGKKYHPMNYHDPYFLTNSLVTAGVIDESALEDIGRYKGDW